MTNTPKFLKDVDEHLNREAGYDAPPEEDNPEFMSGLTSEPVDAPPVDKAELAHRLSAQREKLRYEPYVEFADLVGEVVTVDSVEKGTLRSQNPNTGRRTVREVWVYKFTRQDGTSAHTVMNRERDGRPEGRDAEALAVAGATPVVLTAVTFPTGKNGGRPRFGWLMPGSEQLRTP